jgi:aldehyde:ferredoxin oxidoreductase
MSFEDGMQAGRRIWNLDRAILAVQGRRRDREVFAGYVYDVPSTRPHIMPVYDGHSWSFSGNVGRVLSRQGVEEWKTSFFEMEGWDTGSGWPARETLEELGMDGVADALETRGG